MSVRVDFCVVDVGRIFPLQDSWPLVHYFWVSVSYQLTTNVSCSLLPLLWGGYS